MIESRRIRDNGHHPWRARRVNQAWAKQKRNIRVTAIRALVCDEILKGELDLAQLQVSKMLVGHRAGQGRLLRAGTDDEAKTSSVWTEDDTDRHLHGQHRRPISPSRSLGRSIGGRRTRPLGHRTLDVTFNKDRPRLRGGHWIVLG
jgi:hypothetical protein